MKMSLVKTLKYLLFISYSTLEHKLNLSIVGLCEDLMLATRPDTSERAVLQSLLINIYTPANKHD